MNHHYLTNLFRKSLLIFSILLIASFSALGENQNRKPDLSDMILIPAGEFVMGSNKVGNPNSSGDYSNIKPWYLDEHPEHKVKLPAYYIEEHELTNAQYLKFVEETGHRIPEYWLKNGYILRMKLDKLEKVSIDKLRRLAADTFHIDKDTRKMNKQELLKDITQILYTMDKLAVADVTWTDASIYCEWAGLRLPTEAEWEKAARGSVGYEFPWGNEWKNNMSNTGTEKWDTQIAPVESYPSDKSPFGIYDLAGNVSEWVADWYQPYENSDYKSKDFGKHYKVVRGAGWSGGEGHYALRLFQRGAYRGNLPPDRAFDDVGFRCAADESAIQHAAVSARHK